MPVKILVGHVLGVETDPPLTDPAGVGEVLLVAGNAARPVISQDVALTWGQCYKLQFILARLTRALLCLTHEVRKRLVRIL